MPTRPFTTSIPQISGWTWKGNATTGRVWCSSLSSMRLAYWMLPIQLAQPSCPRYLPLLQSMLSTCFVMTFMCAALNMFHASVLSTVLKPGIYTCNGLVLPVVVANGDLQPPLVWLLLSELILLVSLSLAHTGRASAHLTRSVCCPRFCPYTTSYQCLAPRICPIQGPKI